jgi:ribosome recycling factor
MNGQVSGAQWIDRQAKRKKIGEDEGKRTFELVQKMTDEEIRRMEELSRKEEAEVMQV